MKKYVVLGEESAVIGKKVQALPSFHDYGSFAAAKEASERLNAKHQREGFTFMMCAAEVRVERKGEMFLSQTDKGYGALRGAWRPCEFAVVTKLAGTAPDS